MAACTWRRGRLRNRFSPVNVGVVVSACDASLSSAGTSWGLFWSDALFSESATTSGLLSAGASVDGAAVFANGDTRPRAESNWFGRRRLNRDAGLTGAAGFSDETSVCSVLSAPSLSTAGAAVELTVVVRERPRALNAGRTRRARAVELVGEAVSSMAFSSACFSSVGGAAVVEPRKLKRLRAARQIEIY